MNFVRSLFVILVCGVIVGCASPRAAFQLQVPAETDVGDVDRVAVAEFDGLEQSGRLIAAKLTEGIVEAGRFQMFEREKLQEILDERDFSHSEHVDPATANTLKLLGIDALIFGLVDVYSVDDQTGYTKVETQVATGEYETVVETDEDGNTREVVREITEIVFVDRGYVIREGTMGVTFRMANVNTGQIAAIKAETAHFSEKAWTEEQSKLPAKDMILDGLAREVCQRFLRQIQPQWVTRQVTFEKNENPHTEVGIKFAQNGLWDEAIGAFVTAVRSSPGMSSARYNLALARYAMGDYDGAEIEIEQAIAMEPRDAYIRMLARVRQDAAYAEPMWRVGESR